MYLFSNFFDHLTLIAIQHNLLLFVIDAKFIRVFPHYINLRLSASSPYIWFTPCLFLNVLLHQNCLKLEPYVFMLLDFVIEWQQILVGQSKSLSVLPVQNFHYLLQVICQSQVALFSMWYLNQRNQVAFLLLKQLIMEKKNYYYVLYCYVLSYYELKCYVLNYCVLNFV